MPGDEGQEHAGGERALLDRDDDGGHPAEPAGAGDLCGLLRVLAELHHRRDAGARGVGHLVGDEREHEDERGAVERGDRSARHGEEREVGGGEGDAGHEVGEEGHLAEEGAERAEGGADDDVADEEAEEARGQRGEADDAEAVPGGVPEVGAEEDAGLQRHGVEAGADPVVEGEVVEGEAARHLHQRREDEGEERQADAEGEHRARRRASPASASGRAGSAGPSSPWSRW